MVICDRFVDSTFAYQGGGRQLDMTALKSIQRYRDRRSGADLRVLLDLPVEVGLQRRLGGRREVNRLDVAELGFHRRVRDAFLGLAAEDPDGWVVIDASAAAGRGDNRGSTPR